MPTFERAAAVFDAHERRFARAAPSLARYYDAHANGAKLIALLSFWLYGVACILEEYGRDAVGEFGGGGGSHIRFAFGLEFDRDRSIGARHRRGGWLFPIATRAMGTAFLPGGKTHSVYSKAMWRVTRLALDSAPVVVQDARRRALVDALADAFDLSSTADGDAIRGCLETALPRVFAADPIHAGRRRPLRLDCSAGAFMDFGGDEVILLFDQPLVVVGRQHGGGYDLFDADYFALFEKRLSDRFVGWGMSEVNERQHRYPRRAGPSEVAAAAHDRIVVVERAALPRVMELMLPGVYEQSADQAAIDYVAHELRSTNRTYFNLEYPGTLQSPAYEGRRGVTLARRDARGERALRRGDIVVFDASAASLIHHCIEQEITYVVALSRNTAHWSPAHREWIDALREGRLACFVDEPGALAASIRAVMEPAYRAPADLHAYHLRRFVDI